MPKYVLIKNRIAVEVIPEFASAFPDVPITDRYAPDFIEQLTPVDDTVDVEANWTQNEDGTFSPPPSAPEPDPDFITEEEAIALLFGGSVNA